MAKRIVPSATPESSPADFPFGANGTPEEAKNEVPGQPSVAPSPDPFDAESLRLPEDFNASVGVKKALLTVPVRKPDKSWFVRVHPDEAYRIQTCVIDLKEDREQFLVARSLWSELSTEATFKPKLLVTAINRQGVVFLWDLNLPRSDGRRGDSWTTSGLEAVKLAMTGWVRLSANMSLGAYDVFQASGQLSEPEWPDLPFRELLKVAFRDRFIDTADHPALRKLRGEV